MGVGGGLFLSPSQIEKCFRRGRNAKKREDVCVWLMWIWRGHMQLETHGWEGGGGGRGQGCREGKNKMAVACIWLQHKYTTCEVVFLEGDPRPLWDFYPSPILRGGGGGFVLTWGG